ncbi:MAG: transglutaminase domain-containing protein [Spirochaetales bacterium]|nr:transglutaminase domain-containing protein [Spirochaetales bacterium]
MNASWKNALKFSFSLLVSLGLPVAAAAYLNVLDDSIIPLVAAIAGAQAAALLKIVVKGLFKKILRVSYTAALAIGAFFLLVSVVVIPFPLYSAWMTFVRTGVPSGSISFLFVMGLAYFSVLFGGLFYSAGIVRPLAGLILVILFLVTVIFQEWVFFLVTVFAFIVNALLLVLYPWKFSFRTIRTIIPSLLLSMGLAGLLYLFNQDQRGFLSYYSLSPSIRSMLETTFPDLAVFTALAGYGYQKESPKLGGRAYVNQRPVLEVTAHSDKLIYLRTRVFDKYTGDNWKISDFIIDSRKSAYEHFSRMEEYEPRNPVRVKLLLEYSLFVPHTLHTEAFAVQPYRVLDFSYGSLDTGFELELPVLKNTVLILSEGSDQMPPGDIDKPLKLHCLDVPDNLPDEISKLSARLNGDEPDVNTFLDRMVRYLNDNYTYSLISGYPDWDEDFVYHFLFREKKGYCVHFASSAVILSRLSGYPARYVTGYLVNIPFNRDTIVCTGLSRHAWAEIYIPGEGWRIVEATPPMNPENIALPGYTSLFNSGNDPVLARQLMYLSPQYNQEKEQAPDFNPLLILYSIIIIVCVSGAVFLILFFLKRIVKRKTRLQGYRRQIQKIMIGLVGNAKRSDIADPCIIGWPAWHKEWGRLNNLSEKRILRTLDVVNRVFYSHHAVFRKDVVYIRLVSRIKK